MWADQDATLAFRVAVGHAIAAKVHKSVNDIKPGWIFMVLWEISAGRAIARKFIAYASYLLIF